VAGALAGGTLIAASGFLTLRLDYSMGWCRSRFAENPDPFSLFSPPLLFLIVLLQGVAFLLGSWRVSRRYGWVGTACMLTSAGLIAVRDRLWWDRLMQMMTVAWGLVPVASDAALLASGYALGYAVMRLIAGRARDDLFAR
jgi:hypothetical protein